MPINLSTLLNASSNLQLAKAWVNFNGTTATPSTIRSSYNVSSITKNGTGDYTVNFATPMADANYSAVAGLNLSNGVLCVRTANYSTTSVRIFTNAGTGGALSDADPVSLLIFGN